MASCMENGLWEPQADVRGLVSGLCESTRWWSGWVLGGEAGDQWMDLRCVRGAEQ